MSSTSPVPIFEALSDPARCRVVELLGQAPHSAGQLADLAGLSPSAMSRHLRLLLRTEIIADERDPADARVRMFRLRPERLASTSAWLDQVQAHWKTNLTSFKAHVEEDSP